MVNAISRVLKSVTYQDLNTNVPFLLYILDTCFMPFNCHDTTGAGKILTPVLQMGELRLLSGSHLVVSAYLAIVDISVTWLRVWECCVCVD